MVKKICEGEKVTSDIEEAVKSAEVIMLTIPGFAIETMAKDLAPVVDETK